MEDRDLMICEKRVYNCWTVAQISKNMEIPRDTVERVLKDNAKTIDTLREERRKLYKNKIEDLAKLSHSAYKEILKAKAEVIVVNKEGIVVGTKPDTALMKLKKETADRVLEEVQALTPQKKGGMVIDNRKQTVINNQEDEKKKEIDAQINGAIDASHLKVVGNE